MSRKVNYFEAERRAPEGAHYSLCDVNARWTPLVLSAIESRNGRSFFYSNEDYRRGYKALAEYEWRLLMDATDRIVSEVRSLRQGHLTPIDARDPALDPYTLELVSLDDLRQVADQARTEAISQHDAVLAELQAIKTALQSGGGLDEDILAQLVQIAALLA